MISKTTKTAIVLFNLGGPDAPESVQPFLFNLFNDPAIIRLPNWIRTPLAKLISSRRAPKAQAIYAELGGKSPLLENTQAQANAIEIALAPHGNTKVFIAMRYWKPFSDETAQAVKAYQPDEIILLPLYPQFSTTTTGSSFKDWDRAAVRAGLAVPTKKICCYPTKASFISAHAQAIKTYYDKAKASGNTPRILFSAHGLPEKIVREGDPYQWQVEQTTQAVVKALGIEGLDYVNCYQSRVGPMKWIGPSTESEIARAGTDKRGIVLVPIAFVSEHSETLVELDIEYAHLAKEAGVPVYVRVPTLSTAELFVTALAELCLNAHAPLAAHTGGRICGKEWGDCPCATGE